MTRWSERHEQPGPLLPPTPVATVTVEKILLARLEAVRETLAYEAAEQGWDSAAVDRILAAGSLDPITREYVVQFVEEVNREVRVRATNKEAASSLANGNGGRLVGVREVTEAG